MTLRTPRRRISPRTKRRYRAIKDFFRRAIGNSSQADIQINSSIAVNVTDLKHQIVGIEKQLNEVSKHLICTECTSMTNDSSSTNNSVKTDTIVLKPETSNSRESKTKFLYKTTNDRKSDESEIIEKSESDRNDLKHVPSKKSKHNQKNIRDMKKSKRPEFNMDEPYPYLGKHKSKSTYERFSSAYSTNSYHSMIDPRCKRTLHEDYEDRRHSGHTGHSRHRPRERVECQRELPHTERKEISAKRPVRNEDKYTRRRKEKSSKETCELDPDFINNIIKRQYRPVKIFGRRESDLSQFSAPICRDQEYKVRENIMEGSDLCSCCYADRKPRFVPYNNVSDMRSICDTRLYSSNRNNRQKTHRRHTNIYNDSSMYDVIPVRERSSPKSRKKFIDDMISPSYYKEVPPSPRTLRPRLNLRAQQYNNMDFEEDYDYRSRKYSPRHQNNMDSYSNKSSNSMVHKSVCNFKGNKQDTVQQIMGITSCRDSLPSPIFNNEAGNVNQTQAANTSINKSQDIESNTDKTDKALCEIKDILQNFLLEIKKDSISQMVKENRGNGQENQSTQMKQNNVKIKSSTEEPSHSDLNNCSMGPFSIPPSPYLPPPYINPCCFPIFPTYPVNCMQNSYVVPSPSFTCATCNNKVEESLNVNKENVAKAKTKTTNNTETDKLIKEIYNLVTQSPPTTRKRDDKSIASHKAVSDKKAVVTRSVGDSIRITRHDANVGTPKLKYYSKSCEAIGSPLEEEHTARTTASYSDTVLDKFSLDATAADTTSTETEVSTDRSTEKKDQSGEGNRLSKVLRSFGLLKKKKKDVIEEEDEDESESESSTEVEIKKKRKKPVFPQEVFNYAVHGQEFFHLPPIPPHLHPEYLAHQQNLLHHHFSPYSRYPAPLIQPTAPPCPCASPHPEYSPPYKPPEVPLCLKEIEVRSAGTQSDRKLPFFGKFGKKKPPDIQMLMQRNSMPPPRNCSTQTAQNKPGFWQKLNTPKPMTESDPRMFSFKKQKELASGDKKLKNAMLKKLFHKKNPFSPNNLIVKTLMGRDPSSFGEPPVMYRPRMFL
ncbi:uncharacterized protein LOC106130116 [Amyelois transitella]|uniref:uncharacterized protein LOC106130116 n=1 Tax=Amyelois transitella TaxID=680683 RepID=UPI002990040E|nr:uncharacterized protein LOC106130116 [Amyelois transitella]